MGPLGVRVEVLRADDDLLDFDVIGRARGLIAQGHIHTGQVERHEVLEGSMKLVMGGQTHVLTCATSGTRGARASRRRWCSGWRERSFVWAADLGRPYVFVDEWEVAAPREAVFDAVADARTYPQWWRPVYIDVDADGPAELGKQSHQHFKGRLPYHLNTRSTVVALDPPHTITGDVDGDLRGRGTWTLTATATGTHVRFDWQVFADRRLLRVLTPVLRPVFRWNHNWAIARAKEGLEPFARRSVSGR